MFDPWIQIEQSKEKDCGFLMCAVFPSDSPWFKGHFPQKAILPGVAMLSLAKEAILSWADLRGLNIEITGFNRVRFRRVVFPASTLEVFVTASADFSQFHFEVKLEETVVCKGRARAVESRTR